MKANGWSYVLNLAISILMAFDPTFLFVGPWILVQFLNGRQWFADVRDMGEFMQNDNWQTAILASWQSLVVPLFLGIFAVLALLAPSFNRLSGLVMVKLAVMAVAHLIGYGWYKLDVPHIS